MKKYKAIGDCGMSKDKEVIGTYVFDGEDHIITDDKGRIHSINPRTLKGLVTKEEKVKEQINLQSQIQNAGFNIINCGHCGSVVLHELNEEESIDCPYCDTVLDLSDCPDFLYEGLELSEEFK